MLVYDHQRTEDIINKLRKADATTRLILRIAYTFLFASLASQAGRDIFFASDRPVNAIAGAWFGWVAGLFIGWVIVAQIMMFYTMTLLSPIIEWMCQVLIAQGAIAESLRLRRSK